MRKLRWYVGGACDMASWFSDHWFRHVATGRLLDRDKSWWARLSRCEYPALVADYKINEQLTNRLRLLSTCADWHAYDWYLDTSAMVDIFVTVMRFLLFLNPAVPRTNRLFTPPALVRERGRPCYFRFWPLTCSRIQVRRTFLCI